MTINSNNKDFIGENFHYSIFCINLHSTVPFNRFNNVRLNLILENKYRNITTISIPDNHELRIKVKK